MTMHETPDAPQEVPQLRTLGEQCEYYDAHPEDIRAEHLNNFRLWLPGNDYFATLEQAGIVDRPHERDGSGRHSELWASQTARLFREAVAATLAELPDVQAAMEGVRQESARLKEQAGQAEARMHAAMEAIRDLPDEERRARFRTEVRPHMDERDRLWHEAGAGEGRRMEEAILPLYVAMRRKGYSHYDLVA